MKPLSSTNLIPTSSTFIQNNQTFSLRKHDMFCLFPQVTHEYFTVTDNPLRKIFIAFDGKQNLKMSEAKLLLEQTTYTLSEFAHSVGYPDLFSFSKAFKKLAGIPPTQLNTTQSLE
ncbi:helix-turn-helix domain-containing protein [Paenibacillus sp. N3.4]|uniref:helix-turn-helix domain-containing protein n=1 Tax=Paenibacillus sp. N3.4 TaxID=2603222 RepID=UPI0011C9B9DB|nr:helix-turn-helix domain-containing protein [Paenibacillus sp. N3.4]TXK79824.1 helix-turn-helix domain-containing protein [Paenibacillus sp. N3.4]